MFPYPQQNDADLDTQAREMMQIMAIAGFDRKTFMRLCIRMRVKARDMNDAEFSALTEGARIIPPVLRSSEGT